MIYAAILAGGSGTRMGLSSLPKQFLKLAEKEILIHTVEKFLLNSQIDLIVIAVHPDYIAYCEDLIKKYLSNFLERILITKGGIDRNSSIDNCINALESIKTINLDDIIITHDSVRPFVSSRIIEDNIQMMKKYPCVDTVVKATDTIITSYDQELIDDIPNRNYMYMGQTPQSFYINDFKKLYHKLSQEEKAQLSDACKIFKLNNYDVALVEGDYQNIKITTVTDYILAEKIIEGFK